ncbi:hypothetical protein NQ314_004914 [Rhamnusium bicolor]|uniref:Uncharacterized protein n=1 Tax=Rhamnusium bicolor TaxID=1586634 RepID=A0AAV8ZL32_9CUCU|nr:hypothetical protein NQ314_004914 [Rhamnusium bicolor]
MKCSECSKNPVKYTVSTLGNYSLDMEYFESEVIKVTNEVLRITLDDNIRKICEGDLNITGETLHFFAQNRGIEEIEAGAFANQMIKFKLELNDNSLSRIYKGTFKSMPLNELNLSFNKITTIEPGALENLPNLYLLHLNNNKIKKFYPNSLVNTPDMLIFDMAYNCMEVLEKNHFSFMTKKEESRD